MTHPPNQHDPLQPPDRSSAETERRNPKSMGLHGLSVSACVALINEEDAAVHAAVRGALGAITRFIEAAEPGFVRGGRLIYVGAGTSGRLGVLDASEAPPTFCVEPGRVVGIIAGGASALTRSSEGLEDDPNGAEPDLRALSLTADDTVLGVAAGGTTPYVLGAISLARSLSPGAVTGLLTCARVDAARAGVGAGHVMEVLCGPEVLTGSTRMKAGTATKMVLNMISTTLMVRGGRVYENLMVDVRATNAKLRDRAARIVSALTGLTRADGFGLLDRAGGSVKAAVVMHRLGLSREGAQAALDRAGGRLDAALSGGVTPSGS
ncbi:MAG: N-acetylmuramic acid 6-phosphate etherase [Phycisphaeraceae bacterium]|nr:MAG: N-acetylmuramic acid 6-phosphate etherase [Phycisphaeraceae bacterium]